MEPLPDRQVDKRVSAIRQDYGAIQRASDAESGTSTGPEINRNRRQASHALFSRGRLLTARYDGQTEYSGDYIIHDLLNERTRSYVLETERRRACRGSRGNCEYLSKIYLVLCATGIAAGIIAAGLDLVVEWLSGLKFGYCARSWLLTREVCCDVELDNEVCMSFKSWKSVVRGVVPGFVTRVFLPEYITAFLAFMTIAVVFAATSAFLVKRFAPHAAGSGVPEIKTVLSGVVMKGYLSAWAVVIKSVGLAFSVAAGLNLGKEGPFVHLVSATAHIAASSFQEFRENHWMMMGFVTVGTAAGVSVAFDAPVGGVLFAFEEAASYFPNSILWRSFFTSALAALVLKLMNPFLNGRAVMFQVDHTLDWHWFEMIAFFFIGGLGGLIGTAFIRYNVKWSKFRLHNAFIKRSPIYEVVCIVTLTVLLSYPFVFLRQSNTQILTMLFSECPELSTSRSSDLLCNPSRFRTMILVLTYAALTKLFLTILTFGARVPAGLFVPSMAIGACVGRVIGESMRLIVLKNSHWFIFAECGSSSVCVRPSIYAIVGAAATLGGVTQVSVSLVVIMFELTGGLSHLLPTMVGVLAAKLVCSLNHEDGIYDQHINLRRYPFLDTKHHVSHRAAARDIMRTSVKVIPELGATVGFLRRLLHDHKYYGFPIVRKNSDMVLTGNIVRKELLLAIQRAMQNPDVGDDTLVSFKGEFDEGDSPLLRQIAPGEGYMLNFAGFRDRYLSQVRPDTPISDVYDCFSALGVRMSFVTKNGELLGIISKKDLIAYCDVSEGNVKKYFL